MRLRKITSALLLFAVLAGIAGIGYALTPPPPPPPPVGQQIGLYDAAIDSILTTDGDHFYPSPTNQDACRVCHITTDVAGIGGGTNSATYSNTIGGDPWRHISLVVRNVINPFTNAPFTCLDCHIFDVTTGAMLVNRSCVDCHNGTNFWGDTTTLGIPTLVGNFSRPHHVNTTYASSNIGNPVAGRQCNFCHGSFVNNYNDGHYKPKYGTSIFTTPYATFRATNFSQPDGLGGNKTWGGCTSCHMANDSATPKIGSNRDNHHKEILGFARFGGKTVFQNASTPGVQCSWCHVINLSSSNPLRINILNPITGQFLTNAMELRNSTIETTSPLLEPGTTDITINGTGCEKCHGVMSLHNIQYQYVQNGPQGNGHVNNKLDCYGCHDAWLPADTFTPGALIPTVNSVNPSAIFAGNATTLNITGSNFVNDAYSSVVTVDGVTYTPTSITDTQIVVSIPALTAGAHQLQLVKGGDTLSKLSTLTVVPNVKITSAKLNNGIITITGTGFGTKPATNALLYVSISRGGAQITSKNIQKWTDVSIKVNNSVATIGDVVTVITAIAGEATATIT